MKKLPVTLLLLIITFSLNGMSSIDSLKQELSESSGLTRIDLLLKISQEYQKNSYDSSKIFAKYSLEESCSIGNDSLEFESLRLLGNASIYLSELDSAKQFFSRVLEIAEKREDIVQLANAYNEFGRLNFFQSDYKSGIKNFSQAKEYFEQTDQYLPLGRVIMNLGVMQARLGDYKASNNYYNEARKVYLEHNSMKDVGSAYINIAVNDYFSGEYDSSIAKLSRAAKIFSDEKNIDMEALCYQNIGVNYEMKGNYPLAAEFLKKSLELKQKTGNKAQVFVALQGIGNVYMAWGKFHEGLKYFLEAMDAALKSGTKEHLSSVFSNISSVYIKLGDQKKALEYEMKRYDLSKEIDDKRELLSSITSLVDILLKEGDEAKALEYHEEAKTLAGELDVKKGYLQYSNQKGLIYTFQKEYDKAAAAYKEALEIAADIEEADLETEMSINLGKSYFSLGLYGSAKKYLKEGLTKAEEIEHAELRAEALKYLAFCSEKKGDYTRAYHQFTDYASLNDSLYNLKTAGQMAELQTKYETEKKEKENELLKKQNEIKELQISRQQNYIISGILAVIILAVIYTLIAYKKRLKELKQKQQAELEKARITQELEQAAAMQRNLLPEKFPSSENFEIWAECHPAYEVGGDFFDIFTIGDNGLCVANADVSGKGMKAAMTTVLTSGMLAQVKNMGITDPAEVLNEINRALYEKKSERRLFTALSYAVIDTKKKTLIFTNSGQPEIILFRKGKVKYLQSSDPRIPLGMLKNIKYRDSLVNLEKDDIIIFYSDAFPESQNKNEEQYGYDRIIDSVTTNGGKKIEELGNKMISDLADFIGGAKVYDDTTLIILKMN